MSRNQFCKFQIIIDKISELSIYFFSSIYVLLGVQFILRLYDNFAYSKNLPIFDQAIWLISKGKTPFVTVRGVHILGDHFSSILYLFAPFYLCCPNVKLLLVAQTLAFASGAFPLYWIGIARLKSAPVALLFSVAYLVYAPIQWSNIYEFHPETLCTPLFIYAFHYFQKAQFSRYFVCLVISALTKEVVGVTIIAMGLYVYYYNPRIGIKTIVLGTVAIIVSLFVMKNFSGTSSMPYFSLFSPFQRTYDGNNMLYSLDYTGELLYPFLFLSLLSPKICLLALPAFVANLLSHRASMQTIYFHYTVLITPFLSIAAIYGLQGLRDFGSRYVSCIVVCLLCIIIVYSAINCPIIKGKYPLFRELSRSDSEAVDSVLKQIPPSASLSICQSIISHSAHREKIYLFPNPFCPLLTGATELALRQLEGYDPPFQSTEEMQRNLSNSTIEYIAITPFEELDSSIGKVIEEKKELLFLNPFYGIVAIDKNVVLFKRNADRISGIHTIQIFLKNQNVKSFDAKTAFQDWLSQSRKGDI